MDATGYISEVISNEGFYVFIPFPDTYLLDKRQITEVGVRIDDGRTISAAQRRKVFALIRDITDWICAPGKEKRQRAEKEALRQMQLLYLIDYADTEAVRHQLTQHYCGLLNIELFSLSDVDMTTAGDFIDWLVELCVIHGIPCNDTLLNRCEDTGRYLYACIAYKRCAICGKKAELHHVDHVGMGRNRKEIMHLGMRAEALCMEHHTECHTIGQKTFDGKYYLYGIELDEHLCKLLKLKSA